MNLGDQIKKYRKQNGFTQLQLSDKSNISRSYLADIEKNRYNPSLETLKAIAQALNITLGTLISDNDKISEAVEDFYYDNDNQESFVKEAESKYSVNNSDIELGPLTDDEKAALKTYLELYRQERKNLSEGK